MTSHKITVGEINGPWGVRGHVKVTPFTSNPNRLKTNAIVIVKNKDTTIVDVKTISKSLVLKFDNVDNKEAASKLRGELIEIDESQLPELPSDSFYVHDLEGMVVFSTNGNKIGTLQEVLQTGANDVYLIGTTTNTEILIPAIRSVVLEIDTQNNRMVVGPLDDFSL